MKKAAYLLLLVLLTVTAATPAHARFPDPIPDVDCDTCLCNLSRCEIEVDRRYDICNARAESLGDFFACEMQRDGDTAGCGVEYVACLFSPFR